MAHYFVVVILPTGLRLEDGKERIEECIQEIMSPYDTGSISGDYNDKGFFDWYVIGGRFDGAINGLPNYYHEALELSKKNPDKDYGELFRRLASEELVRNSCVVGRIELKSEGGNVLPSRTLTPDGLREMPEWFIFPDFVRTSDGKLREIPIPLPKTNEESTRQDWNRTWAEITEKYGDNLAVGLDCHL